MNKAHFDKLILKNRIAKLNDGPFGYYVASTDTIHPVYYAKDKFAEFKQEMKKNYPTAYTAYRAGKGSELEEGANGKHPPKMASVASSSRFCYLALRDGAQAFGASGPVSFECGCPIDGIRGTAPQLDACVPTENLFFEVKCHEIFDSHTVKLSPSYWSNIYGTGNDFGFPVLEKGDAQSIQIPPDQFGIEGDSTMFDIKQLLCHLMGIQSKTNSPATLIYLFFKPISDSPEIQAELDALFNTLQKEIQCIFNSEPIRNFCQKNQITLRAVAQQGKIMEAATAANIINLA